MEYILGIDIGTGSVKAVAVNSHGESVDEDQRSYGISAPKLGYHEQDPEEIWSAFIAVCKGIIKKMDAQPMAVSLSSAMHSLIPVNEKGDPLTPMMTWADNRSAEIATRLRTTKEGVDIYKATGTPLHAMSPLCKIIWLRENEPALFQKVYKFISIKEYIWHKLFAEFVIDHSIASSTGLFDINQLTWNQNALKLADITESLLSAPVPTNYSKKYQNVNTSATADFLPQGTLFVSGASDGCLANLGSAATKPGIGAITIGTSGAVRIASNKPLPNEASMTFSYILDEKTFICGGPVNNGGVALQWWLKNSGAQQLSSDDYQNFFNEVAKVPPGAKGLLFLPYLTGERAPIWNSESCGTFLGIKLQHTRADFSRAVLEGICFALKDVLDAVEENAEPVVQINVSGGFTKSAIWVQTLADITGKPMAVIQTDDASAVGAALLALKKIEKQADYPALDTSDQKIFKPDMHNNAIYNQLFAIYKQAYQDLKSTMHKLSRIASA